MERALLLAKNGEGRVSPNPMVGAVIVYDGRIIGEGYHAFYGSPHAEVNAINSVKEEDRAFLNNSALYVTLEPCAHYGKTPPCANLIVNTGIPRVIVGSLDPNPLVAGKGCKILTDEGISVKIGVLQDKCIELNRKFMKAQTSIFPYIILKWAQSADGYITGLDEEGNPCRTKFSTPLSKIWMHRERAGVDAILIGANTERIDNPLLNVREWGGNSPKKYVAKSDLPLLTLLENIRKDNITSLMVEGGRKLLKSFIDNGFYDEIRVEISMEILHHGLKSPKLPSDVTLVDNKLCDGNLIQTFRR